MFELPLSTTLLVFGFPVLWILYTVIFLWRSRHWKDDDEQERPQ